MLTLSPRARGGVDFLGALRRPAKRVSDGAILACANYSGGEAECLRAPWWHNQKGVASTRSYKSLGQAHQCMFRMAMHVVQRLRRVCQTHRVRSLPFPSRQALCIALKCSIPYSRMLTDMGNGKTSEPRKLTDFVDTILVDVLWRWLPTFR